MQSLLAAKVSSSGASVGATGKRRNIRRAVALSIQDAAIRPRTALTLWPLLTIHSLTAEYWPRAHEAIQSYSCQAQVSARRSSRVTWPTTWQMEAVALART